MNIQFKITRDLVNQVRADLKRPHPYAAERVGFISCRVGALPAGGVVVLAHDYLPVPDEDYIQDDTVGAMMGPAAIRMAMQYAHKQSAGMFHVHMHDHRGAPWFSQIDLSEYAKFVPDFWNVRPEMPHGALVLSLDSVAGACLIQTTRKMVRISNITIVGAPLLKIMAEMHDGAI